MGRHGVPARRYGGGEKWGDVVLHLGLGVVGAAAAAGVWVAVPSEVTAVRALVLYTAYAAALTLLLAVVTAATRRLPVVGDGEVDGVPAVGVRARSAEWWYAAGLDLGLAALGGAIVVLGLGAGDGWAPWSLLPGLVGAWFGVRVVLALTGRRRVEAIWLTADEVVHDAPWGRERTRRDQVTQVRPISGTSYVLLRLDGEAERTLCPRPWRGADLRVRDGAGRVEVRCADLGHAPDDLAVWLADELGLPRDQRARQART